jgi:hypothetical protein
MRNDMSVNVSEPKRAGLRGDAKFLAQWQRFGAGRWFVSSPGPRVIFAIGVPKSRSGRVIGS